MPIAQEIQAPEWIDSETSLTDGLDLLGLRLPVQTIGGSLLDGITTVTPSIRYLTIRAWLIYRYGESQRPDIWQGFIDRCLYAESAIVLGNLIQNRGMNGLIGTNEALNRLNDKAEQLQIAPLVGAPAAAVYAGPSDQLNISWSRGDKVPGLTAQRGKPLALALDQSLSGVPLAQDLFAATPATAPVSHLKELGCALRIDQIPPLEREALTNAILPKVPLNGEHSRISTYSALLAIAKEKKAPPSEADMFKAACSIKRFGEPVLDRAADGWLMYCVRDSIAVSQEAVLAAVITEITLGAESRNGVDASLIVNKLVSRITEHNAPLVALKLLEPHESVVDFTFGQLFARIDERLSLGRTQENGVTRWPVGGLELSLYSLALRSGAGALTLAIVAWILAAMRVSAGVKEGSDTFQNLSYQGKRRQGMQQVIMPEIDRLLAENPPITTVAKSIAYRAVQQHLQIAWSRLQFDLHRDVALVTGEGNLWFSRGKGFRASRTASRLPVAIAWLTQLGLIGKEGITTDGASVLARALKTLADAGSK